MTVGALLFVAVTVGFAGAGGLFAGDGDPTEPPRPTLAATGPNGPLVAGGVAPPATTGPGVPADQAEPTPGRPAFAGVAGPWRDGYPVVCLDPGHGGPDTGFTRPAGDGLPELVEADINLANALALRRRLEAKGIVVAMTRVDEKAVNADNADVNGDGLTAADSERDGDYDEIQARIDVCNRSNADLLVSIHVNGFTRETVNGYETWYTGCRDIGDQSGRFATLAYQALAEQLPAAGYEATAREVNDDCRVDVDDSDVHLAANMLITGPRIDRIPRESAMPGSIVEGLFVSNPEDAAFLASDEGTEAIVAAYDQAILAYFAEYPG